MTIEEIRKGAPIGATYYKLMKDGKPLYYDLDHSYWNWVALKWEKTIVHYCNGEVKPL